ncbi:uncharacterized protein PV07_03797 [Cladophialophora immunda]|uniref:4-coumarate-CoA ligase n=1 Tax=Cladophialophora immunda TaxID=569365 RepID=A0A0D2B3P9_9EURO|nr:uncharacterized protein PV07_03797 [Cladophialophora immunda]KIW32237.1 hypothetical protein PV07_03797 [Cladophialophora immunda]
MPTIYRNAKYPSVEWPKLDLLTLLFDSEHTLAQDDAILHISAENPKRTLTKRALRSLTQRIAHTLRTKYGVGSSGPGNDVVTVMSHGQPALAAAFLGVIAAGGVYSAASPSLSADELSHQVRVGDTKLIICSQEVKEVACQTARSNSLPLENVLVLESDPLWSLKRVTDGIELLTEHQLVWETITDPARLKESLIVIVWSSGTTGVPKGVMLSHQNLVSHTYIQHYQGRELAAKQVAEGTYEPWEFRILAHLPASHISGLFGYLISAHYGGGVVVWMRKYQWDLFLAYTKRFRITYMFTVPSIYLRIAKSPDVTDQFASLRTAATGSAPMDSNLQASASTKLRLANDWLVGPTWGLTETTGGVTMTQSYQNDEIGSLGPLLPCLELRLVDDNFVDVKDGEPGELLVRGPTVMNGYFNNPEATKEAFHEHWLRTGDIAIRRAGHFYIVDRKKELLKYKGLQIAPAELEHLLIQHPAVHEAAVIGVPSPDDPSSDLPRAYVVAGSSDVTEQEIQRYVKERLAAHKQLRGGVVFVDEIPKNASGKVLRRELRDRARRELGQGRAKL